MLNLPPPIFSNPLLKFATLPSDCLTLYFTAQAKGLLIFGPNGQQKHFLPTKDRSGTETRETCFLVPPWFLPIPISPWLNAQACLWTPSGFVFDSQLPVFTPPKLCLFSYSFSLVSSACTSHRLLITLKVVGGEAYYFISQPHHEAGTPFWGQRF